MYHYHLADKILQDKGVETQEERDSIQLRTAAFVGLPLAAALAAAVLTTDASTIPVDDRITSPTETVLAVDDSFSR